MRLNKLLESEWFPKIEIFVLIYLEMCGSFGHFGWPVVIGMLGCLVIFYAKNLIPVQPVGFDPKFEEMRQLKNKIVILEGAVSDLNLKNGISNKAFVVK